MSNRIFNLYWPGSIRNFQVASPSEVSDFHIIPRGANHVVFNDYIIQFFHNADDFLIARQ
ncbi:hypothetical protein [Methanobrevibacter sp.]|uniref:hypothetical protein n=1 Tax=Methanobrevibacter sp. TaxID=66852 RepID=UPI003976CD3D